MGGEDTNNKNNVVWKSFNQRKEEQSIMEDRLIGPRFRKTPSVKLVAPKKKPKELNEQTIENVEQYTSSLAISDVLQVFMERFVQVTQKQLSHYYKHGHILEDIKVDASEFFGKLAEASLRISLDAYRLDTEFPQYDKYVKDMLSVIGDMTSDYFFYSQEIILKKDLTERAIEARDVILDSHLKKLGDLLTLGIFAFDTESEVTYPEEEYFNYHSYNETRIKIRDKLRVAFVCVFEKTQNMVFSFYGTVGRLGKGRRRLRISKKNMFLLQSSLHSKQKVCDEEIHDVTEWIHNLIVEMAQRHTEERLKERPKETKTGFIFEVFPSSEEPESTEEPTSELENYFLEQDQQLDIPVSQRYPKSPISATDCVVRR